jgi:4-hydroxy-tetrahydrodipicolinate synthase
VIINQPAPGMFGQSLQMSASSPDVIADALQMENVFGYIMGGQTRFGVMLHQRLPENVRFWGSNGVLLLAQGAIGANGACLMLGNVAPERCIELLRLTMAGSLVEARKVHEKLVELDRQILDRGAAGIKGALHLMGFEGLAPRSPASPLSGPELDSIHALLEDARLLS